MGNNISAVMSRMRVWIGMTGGMDKYWIIPRVGAKELPRVVHQLASCSLFISYVLLLLLSYFYHISNGLGFLAPHTPPFSTWNFTAKCKHDIEMAIQITLQWSAFGHNNLRSRVRSPDIRWPLFII